MVLEGTEAQEEVHLRLHALDIGWAELGQYSSQAVTLWTSGSQPCPHIRITQEAATEWPAGHQDLRFPPNVARKGSPCQGLDFPISLA